MKTPETRKRTLLHCGNDEHSFKLDLNLWWFSDQAALIVATEVDGQTISQCVDIPLDLVDFVEELLDGEEE